MVFPSAIRGDFCGESGEQFGVAGGGVGEQWSRLDWPPFPWAVARRQLWRRTVLYSFSQSGEGEVGDINRFVVISVEENETSRCQWS